MPNILTFFYLSIKEGLHIYGTKETDRRGDRKCVLIHTQFGAPRAHKCRFVGFVKLAQHCYASNYLRGRYSWQRQGHFEIRCVEVYLLFLLFKYSTFMICCSFLSRIMYLSRIPIFFVFFSNLIIVNRIVWVKHL